MKVKLLKVLSIAAVGVASVALAQTTDFAKPNADFYKLNYFTNQVAPAPDGAVRIDNPGLTYGNICAMIYVFNWDQQMAACCGCVETPNGLRTLSIRKDLAGNPLTGKPLATGMIKIISAAYGGGVPTQVSAAATGFAPPCDPSAKVRPIMNLRAWGSHVQDRVGTTTPAVYPVTETEFSNSPLGAMEYVTLQAQCAFIGILGSGQGLCTCGTGD